MNEIVALIIVVIVLIASELFIHRLSLSWKTQQLIVTAQTLVLAFLAVFTETFISYITWVLFIGHTVFHLKDSRGQLSDNHTNR